MQPAHVSHNMHRLTCTSRTSSAEKLIKLWSTEELRPQAVRHTGTDVHGCAQLRATRHSPICRRTTRAPLSHRSPEVTLAGQNNLGHGHREGGRGLSQHVRHIHYYRWSRRSCALSSSRIQRDSTESSIAELGQDVTARVSWTSLFPVVAPPGILSCLQKSWVVVRCATFPDQTVFLVATTSTAPDDKVHPSLMVLCAALSDRTIIATRDLMTREKSFGLVA